MMDVLRTYLLQGAVRLERLTGLQLVKKFPRNSRNPKVHYRTHKHKPLVYPGPAQSSPHVHNPPPTDPSYYPPIYT